MVNDKYYIKIGLLSFLTSPNISPKLGESSDYGTTDQQVTGIGPWPSFQAR